MAGSVSLEQEGDGVLKVTRDRASGLPEFFSVTALWIDCVLDVLGSASEIDFGRGEPEMRAIPESDAHAATHRSTIVRPQAGKGRLRALIIPRPAG